MMFSIILPVYNGERYLKYTLNSIRNLRYSDYELIIINNASVDNTSVICKEYVKDTPNCIYHENDINRGLIYSLNYGLRLATGDYIVRMDADDIYHKDLLNTYEREIARMKSRDNFILFCRNYLIRESSIRLPLFKYELSQENVQKVLLLENQINHPSVCFPRSKVLLEMYGSTNFNVEKFEDLDLWVRLTNSGASITISRDRYLLYRVHPNSITRSAGLEKALRKHDYNSNTELKRFFSKDDLEVISGIGVAQSFNLGQFSKKLQCYIEYKGWDKELNDWAIFYKISLIKRNFVDLSISQKIESLFSIGLYSFARYLFIVFRTYAFGK